MRSHYSFETTQNTHGQKKKNHPLHTSITTTLAQGKQYIYIYISSFLKKKKLEIITVSMLTSQLEHFLLDSHNLNIFSLKP